MFSIVTVASSTRMPTASASPPSVITLMVSPIAESAAIEARIASGIEIVMISVERQRAQKDQDHQAGQGRGDRALENDRVHRGVDEGRLVADGVELEALRQRLLQFRQQRLDAVDDVERRDRTGLDDRHQHRIAAVDAHHVDLRRRAVVGEGDVAQEHRRAVDDLDRHIVKRGDLIGRAVEIDDVFEIADLLGADRGDYVLAADRVDDVLRRQAVGLQLLLIEIDLHLSDFAAIRRRNRRAGDAGELRADEVLPVVLEFRLRQRFARQRELQHRHARSLEAEDEGRRDAGRQILEHGLRGGGGLRERRIDVDIGLEEHLDDAVARHRLRLHMLDVVDLRAQACVRNSRSRASTCRRRAGRRRSIPRRRRECRYWGRCRPACAARRRRRR